ncbi:MAG: Uma2 family endonuclease [Candidatus Rifleibacteriota bacterium]
MAVLNTKKSKNFTYFDYCNWPDNRRIELIEGCVHDMTPAPGRLHASISRELFLIFAEFFKEKDCESFTAPFDVRLPENDESDNQIQTVVQPDILIVCDEEKLDEKGCRGAPDLIIEILSPSTASKDCIVKRRLYEKHRVKEYWTVDPVNRITTVYLLDKDGYFGKSQIYSDEDTIEVGICKDLKVEMSLVFPNIKKIVGEPVNEYRI